MLSETVGAMCPECRATSTAVPRKLLLRELTQRVDPHGDLEDEVRDALVAKELSVHMRALAARSAEVRRRNAKARMAGR